MSDIVPIVIVVVSAAAFGLIGFGIWRWSKRRTGFTVERALSAVAIERIKDVLVPDGMGGEIHIEHLVLTAHGVLVINVKRFDGIIFASDRMDKWTSIGRAGRSTFPNPLGDLYDRVAAVRQLVRDVDVAGFVVFPSTADFSKGRPEDVLLPEDVAERYAKPDGDETARRFDAFAPHWDRIRTTVRPASG